MDLFIPRSPADYGNALLRRKSYFLVPFLTVLVLMKVVIPFIPRSYEATVGMLMEEESFLNPAAGEKDMSFQPKMERQLRVLSLEILSSPMLERIVRDQDLGLGDPSMSAEAAEQAALRLKKRITVKIPFDGLLVLTYRDRTAHGAQRVVNALANAIVEKNRQDKMTQAQNSVEFTAAQLRLYKDRLQNAEASYFTGKVQSELADARNRREVLRERLEGLRRNAASQVDRKETPQVIELRRDLLRTESLLKQLEGDSKGDNPLVRGMREKVEALKQQLAFEAASRLDVGAPGSGGDFQQPAAELKELDQHIKSLEARRDDWTAGRLQRKNLTDAELAAVEREKKINEDIYQSLRARLENAEISQKMDSGGHSRKLEIIDPAPLPTETGPDAVRLWALGVVLALAAGAGSVALREVVDGSFRHAADAADFLGGAPLGVVPVPDGPPPELPGNLSPSVAVFHRPASAAAEAVRLLRSSLLALDRGDPFKVLLVAGASPEDGGGVLAADVAVSLARELSKKVLLLDGDLSRGRAAALLGVPQGRGLSDFLAGPGEPPPAPRATRVEGLWVLSSGTPVEAPSRFLGLARLSDFIHRLRPQFDFLVVAAPPAVGSADVPVLLEYADRALLVVRRGATPRARARRALEVLQASPRARLAGYVLTEPAADLPSTAGPGKSPAVEDPSTPSGVGAGVSEEGPLPGRVPALSVESGDPGDPFSPRKERRS